VEDLFAGEDNFDKEIGGRNMKG